VPSRAVPETVVEQIEVPPAASASFEDELYEIETPQLRLSFSKIGGNLREVYLKDYKLALLQKNFMLVDGYTDVAFVFALHASRTTLHAWAVLFGQALTTSMPFTPGQGDAPTVV